MWGHCSLRTPHCYSASLHPGVQKSAVKFNVVMDYHPVQGELKILLVASCHRN